MRRWPAWALAIGVLAAGCTGSEGSGVASTSTPGTSTPPTATSAPPAPTTSVPAPVRAGGAPTAQAALRSLCVAPEGVHGGDVEPGDTPPAIAEVQDQVGQVRGLRFLEPVAVEPIDDATMDRKLAESFDAYYPEDLYARRSAAWRTIGVIPPDVDLREALRAYLAGQVIGYYEPATGELVYLGDQGDDLGLLERLTLAHELTHALDDQHFDLSRLDDLVDGCREEEYAAALGVVEGSAQYFSTEALVRFPDIDLADVLELLGQALAAEEPAGVPPFVAELRQWSYLVGQAFVTEIAIADGVDAVDDALRDPPVSTEQLLHPEAYPDDVPTPVDIKDVSAALGPGWGDLDAMAVGEAWLAAMLRLHLDGAAADEAAAGWDGGVYRAWSDGDDLAVALRTAWDTPGEAEAFAGALEAWFEAGGATGEVASTDGGSVLAVFATDEDLLDPVADAA